MEREREDEQLERVSVAARDATADLEPTAEFTERTMSAVRQADAADDPFADLWASIADRTDGLAPRADLTSRVMAAVAASDTASTDVDPLERLALRTARLDASPGFDDRVMKRVRRAASRSDERRADATREGLARNGIRALFAAAAVAAAAMIYAGVSERNLDADVLANMDPVDMGE